MEDHPQRFKVLNEMMHQKPPTKEEAVARTLVVWDIKSCPLPSGCDARRVGPSIKRALENLGYSGTLTITAIGHLIGVPHDVLRSVLSTGISLHHIPFDQVNILDAMYQWCKKNPPPANILFITMRNFIGLEFLREKGYNILRQIWYDDSLEAIPTSTDVERLWRSFLTGTIDSEEKSSETSECDWFCAVCIIKAGVDLAGKGFENFTKHLSSRKHRENMLGLLPCSYKLKLDEEEVGASLDSHPKNATIIVNKESMASFNI